MQSRTVEFHRSAMWKAKPLLNNVLRVTRRLLLRCPKIRFLLLAVVLSSRLEPLNTVAMNGT